MHFHAVSHVYTIMYSTCATQFRENRKFDKLIVLNDDTDKVIYIYHVNGTSTRRNTWHFPRHKMFSLLLIILFTSLKYTSWIYFLSSFSGQNINWAPLMSVPPLIVMLGDFLVVSMVTANFE